MVKYLHFFFTIVFSLTLCTFPANAYTQTDLDHLLLTNECNFCDLSEANLSNLNLYGSSLIEADLSEANLSGSLLSEANLSGSNLSKADLSEADLSVANLSRTNLKNANLNKANLYGVDLSEANAKFTNLNQAILSQSNLFNANFTSALMEEVNLSQATLTEANLSDAYLFRARMPDDTIYKGNITQFGAFDDNPYDTVGDNLYYNYPPPRSPSFQGKFVLVPIFFTTDRKPSEDNSLKKFYSADRGNKTEFGIAKVSIPEDHKMGHLEYPTWWQIRYLSFKENSAKHIILQGIEKLEKDQFWLKLRTDLKNLSKSDVLIFIHGYNTSFKDAAR